eukprot:CAMPEP_0168539752 /NCGR_PEP_ID=MMETSP0405-20121227/22031_1 /TAXON_ID=498012 /ORGANISM="Trichosphaerium sp, Strain Am-I-7 wt" /LENGTH=246 /DNA_ID=CAMNT_0008569407 /DNA_START=49 /DNA_END=789 /DNA_ORIENTATION=+
MILSLMNDKGGNVVSRQLSEKALEGYCQFHHILLYYAKQFPEMSTIVNTSVEKFFKDPSYRIKKEVPNIGEFLIYLTLSKKNWKDLHFKILLEIFDRNVKWIIAKHPKYAIPTETIPDLGRLQLVFDATTVSMRLLMFQVHFLDNYGRPANKSLNQLLDDYNYRCGIPSNAMKESLWQACKEIMKVKTWPQFFKKIKVPTPTTNKLTIVLNDAIKNSKEKRYHRDYTKRHNNRSKNKRGRRRPRGR